MREEMTLADPEQAEGPYTQDAYAPIGQTPASQRIGRIVSISGCQVVMTLEHAGAHDQPVAPVPPQIGALVRMQTYGTTVFGMVSALSIPIPAQSSDEREIKIVEMDLLGECIEDTQAGRPTFRRGVSRHPALGDDVFAASAEDLRLVYAQPNVHSAPIGTVHQDRDLPALVAVDELLGKHFAILGTTGCGKSCAVALILHSILDRHSNGHVLLLDLHNEYAHAFAGRAEVLSAGDLELPYWLLNFDEIKEIFVSKDGDRRAAEAAKLREAIVEAKRRYYSDGRGQDTVTVDAPVPYRLSDLERVLDDAAGRLDEPTDAEIYLGLKARLADLSSDRRYAFMFPGISVRDNLGEILSRLFRIPVDDKPVTVVDLSAVPSEILNVVVSVLCRITFDFAQWSDQTVPILLVCEEAHRYAPQDDRLGFRPTRNALARIAKEGRKYGVSLCVVSQRPAELDSSVVSQCNTVFAMRLTNQQDQEFVRSALSDSAAGLVDALPTLRNAEAIAVGEGIAVPARLSLNELPEHQRPKSGTASFASSWDDESCSSELIGAVIRRWRRQQR